MKNTKTEDTETKPSGNVYRYNAAEALEMASRRLETAAMTYARINSESEKLSPCYAIHRKRHLQSTYGEESKWVTTDKRIKIMGKIGVFAMVCEEQGMPYVVEISEIIPLG